MSTHDLIVTYKDTEKHDFPLVLVIGREPNNESPFSPTTGQYDFDDAPKCAFWNTSFGSIGAPYGLSTQSMKQKARLARACPIAFTDASPIPIGNSNIDKKKIRSMINESTIRKHVEDISSMDIILERTSLVILSGHRSGALSKVELETFAIASTMLETMCDSRSIPHISVPFMYGTNQPSIISTLRTSTFATNAIQGTLQTFDHYFNPPTGVKAA